MTVSYEAAATAPTRSSAEDQPAKKGVRPGQLLKIGITLGLTAYVLWRAGLGDSIETLRGAAWAWVALAACSALFAMVLNVRRWQMMLAGQGGAAPLPTLIRLYRWRCSSTTSCPLGSAAMSSARTGPRSG
jgi:uncharacterized membrane protein YbhN (UPF0104 family)